MTAEVSTGLAVAAKLLGDKPFLFETVLEEVDCDTKTFLAPYQIVLLTPIKFETENCLWMGTVTTCTEEGSLWRSTVHVEHFLEDLPELLKLAARFE